MRVATVPYLNTLPLVSFLSSPVNYAVPAQLAYLLNNDLVDVALMPVYSILQNEFYAYPELGLIGCDGAVKSVGFFTKPSVSSLAQIRSLYLDIESATSIRLAQILLTKFYFLDWTRLKFLSFDEKEQADAQVLIGDKALFPETPCDYKFWDMGDLWKQHTGQGFVFACWASKKKITPTDLDFLDKAKKHGTKEISALVRKLDKTSMQKQVIEDYLTHSIHYEFSESLKNGFALYENFLRELQILKTP